MYERHVFVYILFLFIFCYAWFVYDWSSAVIAPNGLMKAALHIEDLATFDDYQDWF